jgi:predicted AlkP superfamily phosphohydrolase/phosphomutase
MRGREPQGIVAPGAEYEDVCNALIGALRNDWRDPMTGEPVVEQALRKEDAYTGEYLFSAPDLVITWRPGYAPSARAAALRLDGAPVQVSDRPGARAASVPYARLIASGPAFLPGGCAIGRLVDVVPSVLYLFGLPIPAHLDGHVMSDLFSSAYRDQTPIIHASAEVAPLSMEEEEAIVDRLAALGYLG